MEKLYKKISNVKKEVGILSKNTINPFFTSKYFDINQLIGEVEPLLEKNELILLQPIINGCVVSKIIDIETAKEVSSEMKLPELSDPQKVGSAITYYRRYTLQSLLGLQAEDDDANKASGNKTSTKENSLASPEKWLNKFESDKTTVTRDWNRSIASLKQGKDVKYLRGIFKISKENENLLIQESK